MYRRYKENLPLNYGGTSMSPQKDGARKNEAIPLVTYDPRGHKERIDCKAPVSRFFKAGCGPEEKRADELCGAALESALDLESALEPSYVKKSEPSPSLNNGESSPSVCKEGGADDGVCRQVYEKSKSESSPFDLLSEKFSLEDLIFIGILFLLVSKKSDDEIILMIGLLIILCS